MLEGEEKPHNAVYLNIGEDLDMYLPLGLKPEQEERGHIEKEITVLSSRITAINERLSHNEFLERAPHHIVEQETKKRNDYLGKIEKLEEQLKKITAISYDTRA